MLHGININVLTGANPFINFGMEFTRCLKHCFVSLTISYRCHQINPPSIVLEIIEKTAGVGKVKRLLATGQGRLIIIFLYPSDIYMSSQKHSML